MPAPRSLLFFAFPPFSPDTSLRFSSPGAVLSSELLSSILYANHFSFLSLFHLRPGREYNQRPLSDPLTGGILCIYSGSGKGSSRAQLSVDIHCELSGSLFRAHSPTSKAPSTAAADLSSALFPHHNGAPLCVAFQRELVDC